MFLSPAGFFGANYPSILGLVVNTSRFVVIVVAGMRDLAKTDLCHAFSQADVSTIVNGSVFESQQSSKQVRMDGSNNDTCIESEVMFGICVGGWATCR
jgi:hypothetical protein